MSRRSLALCVLLVACAGTRADAAGRPTYGGRLRAPVASDPGTTNPLRAWTHAQLSVGGALHEPLLRAPSGGGRARPAALAELPEISDGGSVVTLRLRPGLTFHGGSPVTANDLAATLRALADPGGGSPWRGLLPGLRSVAVQADLVVALRFDPPLKRPLVALAAPVLAPLPAPEVRGQHPQRAGPFRTKAVGEPRELVAFERHWRGRPFLDALTYVAVAPGREQQVAMRLRRLGASFSAPRKGGSSGTAHQAPETLVALALGGRAARALGPWLRSGLDPPSLRRFSPHPAAAVTTGKAAGRPDGRGDGRAQPPGARLELRVRADRADLRAMAEAVMVALLDLGARVTVRTLSPDEQLQALLAGRPGVDLVEWLEPVGAGGAPPPGLSQLAGGPGAVVPLLRIRRQLWLKAGLAEPGFSRWGVPLYENVRRDPRRKGR